MRCTKTYLKQKLEFIMAREKLFELEQEFGSEHPKVIRYNFKMQKMVDELAKQADGKG